MSRQVARPWYCQREEVPLGISSVSFRFPKLQPRLRFFADFVIASIEERPFAATCRLLTWTSGAGGSSWFQRQAGRGDLRNRTVLSSPTDEQTTRNLFRWNRTVSASASLRQFWILLFHTFKVSVHISMISIHLAILKKKKKKYLVLHRHQFAASLKPPKKEKKNSSLQWYYFC